MHRAHRPPPEPIRRLQDPLNPCLLKRSWSFVTYRFRMVTSWHIFPHFNKIIRLLRTPHPVKPKKVTNVNKESLSPYLPNSILTWRYLLPKGYTYYLTPAASSLLLLYLWITSFHTYQSLLLLHSHYRALSLFLSLRARGKIKVKTPLVVRVTRQNERTPPQK